MAKPTLPKEWRQFANRYGKDRAYWYVPKGLAVTTESLKPRLKVLKEFETVKRGAIASRITFSVSTRRKSRSPRLNGMRAVHRSPECSSRCSSCSA